jgi:hypothetical protein
MQRPSTTLFFVFCSTHHPGSGEFCKFISPPAANTTSYSGVRWPLVTSRKDVTRKCFTLGKQKIVYVRALGHRHPEATAKGNDTVLTSPAFLNAADLSCVHPFVTIKFTRSIIVVDHNSGSSNLNRKSNTHSRELGM